MRKPIRISAQKAAELVKDNATVLIDGGGAGHAVPDEIVRALGERYQQTQSPKNLFLFHPRGIGNNVDKGLNHLAHAGLVYTAVGGFWGNAPSMCALLQAEKLRGYNFPQGVLTQLTRSIAAGAPALLTTTGLHTFVDPRQQGGKLNSSTTDDLVELVTVNHQESLAYKTFPIDVAIIRGTSLDKEGNLTMQEEVGTFGMLSSAQAARVNRGIVIAQVKRIDEKTHAKPVDVRVPGVFIDYVVEAPEQKMTFITDHDEALITRDIPFREESNAMCGLRPIISKRAALEIQPGDFINLGYGMADAIPIIARREGIKDEITFFIEQGPLGGELTTGLNFGAMYNPSQIQDDAYMMDFISGGGLDIAFLGFAQVDQFGNVNSSYFAGKLTGCGGAIDISQHTRHVCFCGSFAVKSEQTAAQEKLTISNPGKFKKFISRVEHITFNGRYALEQGIRTTYITERAVFELTADGLLLSEIAPGVDLQSDILDMMEFRPEISDSLKVMRPDIFSDKPLNLAAHFTKE